MKQWLDEVKDAIDHDFKSGRINFITWRMWRDAVWDARFHDNLTT